MRLRLKILFTFGYIIFAAMFLMSMVTLYLYRQIFIQYYTEKWQTIGKALIIGSEYTNKWLNKDLNEINSPIDFLINEEELLAFCYVDRNQQIIYEVGKENDLWRLKNENIKRVIATGKEQISFQSFSWDFLFRNPISMLMALPIKRGHVQVAIIGFAVPIGKALKNIGALQRLLSVYLIINTILFTIIGFFRVSPLVITPIKKLIQRASEYRQSDDLLLPIEGEGSEWNTLSRSINRIVALNMKDNQVLQNTVESLEIAMDKLQAAQNEIIRAEKLATVGRLASGVAHEIGNPIGILLGYLELIQQPSFSEIERVDLIQRACVQVKRIDLIIRQLLDYSRAEKENARAVSVHDSLIDTINIARLQPIFSGIEITETLKAKENYIIADLNRIQQAFINLLLNAADAIDCIKKKEGSGMVGKIHILTENVIEDTGVHTNQKGIRISISDNGEGISTDNLGKIFDPFFTTKPPGKGTGLGLWVSILIIEGFGGKIWAQSSAGVGSTLFIFFPIVEQSFDFKSTSLQ